MSTPYYQDDLVKLYHGDCREVTEWLDADVLVTDPPYGIAWRQNPGRFSQGGRSYAVKKMPSIANDETTDVRDWALDAFGNDRPAVVFGSLSSAPPLGCKQVLVWQKAANAGVVGALGAWRRDVEAVYLLGGWDRRAAPQSSVLHVGGSVNAAGVDGHPHAKPIALMRHLIGATSGSVADPFAGTGSTLIAAKYLGRRVVGVEIEERYCEMAARRLAQDLLFGDAVVT